MDQPFLKSRIQVRITLNGRIECDRIQIFLEDLMSQCGSNIRIFFELQKI